MPALIDAVQPRVRGAGYYRHHPQQDDGGYLEELVAFCQQQVERSLPLMRSRRCSSVRTPCAAAPGRAIRTRRSIAVRRRSRVGARLRRWAPTTCGGRAAGRVRQCRCMRLRARVGRAHDARRLPESTRRTAPESAHGPARQPDRRACGRADRWPQLSRVLRLRSSCGVADRRGRRKTRRPSAAARAAPSRGDPGRCARVLSSAPGAMMDYARRSASTSSSEWALRCR